MEDFNQDATLRLVGVRPAQHVIIAPNLFRRIVGIERDEIAVNIGGSHLPVMISRWLMPKHTQLDVGVAISVSPGGRATDKHSSDLWIRSIDEGQLLGKSVAPLTCY